MYASGSSTSSGMDEHEWNTDERRGVISSRDASTLYCLDCGCTGATAGGSGAARGRGASGRRGALSTRSRLENVSILSPAGLCRNANDSRGRGEPEYLHAKYVSACA
jgi:hypothetical protein